MDTQARNLRKKGIRAKVKGSQKRLRLAVFRSNLHIYACLVNDQGGKTLLAASEKDIKGNEKLPRSDRAFHDCMWRVRPKLSGGTFKRSETPACRSLGEGRK